jgi:sugar phosphate isomerase/epimerase
MMHISCSDYTFPLLPRAKRFAMLELLGFHLVDLGLFERSTGLRPAQLAADSKGFTRQLKSELRHTRLRVSDVFLQVGLEPSIAAANDPNPRVRTRNRKMFLLALELCSAFDCAHLTGLPGVRHPHVPEADDLALAHEVAAWRQHVAAGVGVKYAIEPHIGSICSDVASTRAFVESVPGLTLTLDYGHFVAAGTPCSEIHPLLQFASHLHARGGAPGQLQATVAENTIDFEGIVRYLRERKYRGCVAVEYVWTEWGQCNRVDNVSEAILLRQRLEDLIRKTRRQKRSEEEVYV